MSHRSQAIENLVCAAGEILTGLAELDGNQLSAEVSDLVGAARHLEMALVFLTNPQFVRNVRVNPISHEASRAMARLRESIEAREQPRR